MSENWGDTNTTYQAIIVKLRVHQVLITHPGSVVSAWSEALGQRHTQGGVVRVVVHQVIVACAPSQAGAQVVVVGVVEVAPWGAGQGVVGQGAHTGGHGGQRGQRGETVDGEVGPPPQRQIMRRGVVVARAPHLAVEVAVGS